MVSKPLVPPWSDSGKNLVRDIVTHAEGFRFHVLVTRGPLPPGAAPLAAADVVLEPVYRDAGRYAPSLWENVRVLGRLARPDRVPLYHFFFAPNPRTSKAARLVLRWKRRRTVHTILSRPRDFAAVAPLMFADRVVVLSEHTRAAMEAAGVPGVVHIPPAVPRAAALSEDALRAARARYALGDEPFVLYAGDYEFSAAAQAVAEAAIRLVRSARERRRPLRVVFACRLKQAASRPVEARIRAEIEAAGVAEHVTFLNELDDLRPLVAAAAVQVQPAGSLYAKMDLPLVLIESLREGVPIVVADTAPLNELLRDDVGRAVPPEDGAALAAAVEALLADDGLRRRLGAAGRAVAATRHAPEAMGAAYAALYRELLESNPA
jgi:glycosyltransferase involved in cell wall biosynthesis